VYVCVGGVKNTSKAPHDLQVPGKQVVAAKCFQI
jgi:hypothetical protein